MTDLDPKKIEKVTQKLYGIALTKVINGSLPQIEIGEFKHLICTYKIPLKEWLNFALQLESMGIVRYHRNHYLEVKLNSQALVVVYNLKTKPGPKIIVPDKLHR
jgi:hypothetical protein